jgi:hypothetical protein
MPAIFERRVRQATAKSLEPQFNNAVLLKCNASLFHTLANYRPGEGLPEAIWQKPFSGPTTSISACDEIGPQHRGCIVVMQSTMELVP